MNSISKKTHFSTVLWKFKTHWYIPVSGGLSVFQNSLSHSKTVEIECFQVFCVPSGIQALDALIKRYGIRIICGTTAYHKVWKINSSGIYKSHWILLYTIVLYLFKLKLKNFRWIATKYDNYAHTFFRVYLCCFYFFMAKTIYLAFFKHALIKSSYLFLYV